MSILSNRIRKLESQHRNQTVVIINGPVRGEVPNDFLVSTSSSISPVLLRKPEDLPLDDFVAEVVSDVSGRVVTFIPAEYKIWSP